MGRGGMEIYTQSIGERSPREVSRSCRSRPPNPRSVQAPTVRVRGSIPSAPTRRSSRHGGRGLPPRSGEGHGKLWLNLPWKGPLMPIRPFTGPKDSTHGAPRARACCHRIISWRSMCIAVTRMDREQRLPASPHVSTLTAHARGGRRRSWNQTRYLLIFSRCAAGA
jgi:hypothetical protein